jgi:hypothetical protein
MNIFIVSLSFIKFSFVEIESHDWDVLQEGFRVQLGEVDCQITVFFGRLFTKYKK